MTIRFLSSNRTQNPLLIIRAIACLVIIWAHTGPVKGWLPVRDFEFLAYPSAFAAVFVFFLLSAYGIGFGFNSGHYKYTIPSLLKFYRNRILRIVPLYYLCILVSYFIFYRDLNVRFSAIIPFFTFTANDISTLPFQGPLSIISTEMQFYLLAPVLFVGLKKLLQKTSLISTTIMIIFVGTSLRFLLVNLGASADPFAYSRLIYTTVWGNLDIFLFGLLLSMIIPRISFRTTSKIAFQSALLVLFAAWYIWSSKIFYLVGTDNWFNIVKYQNIFILPPTTAIVIGLIIIYLVNKHDLKPSTVIKSAPFQSQFQIVKSLLYQFGVLSYGLYVWHVPIINTFFNPLSISTSLTYSLYRFIVVITLTLMLSQATYILVEQPFLKLKSNN